MQPFKNIFWPDASEIAQVQDIYFPNSNFARTSDGLLVDTRNRIVIPIHSDSLRLRLCVIAHAGCNSGHLGFNTALALLKDRVYWVGMDDDLRKICSSCLHCLPTRKGFRIPRPLGTACHGVKPNQVLHFDYLYVAPAFDNSLSCQWIFVIRDDFSGMVLLKPVHVPNTHFTVEALLEWRALFGNPQMLVSDQAS